MRKERKKTFYEKMSQRLENIRKDKKSNEKQTFVKKKNKVLNNFLCKRKILKKLYFILFCLVLSF